MSLEFRRAIAEDLEVLALLHERELTAEVLAELRSSQFPSGLGLTLVSPAAGRARELWATVLRQLPEILGADLIEQLAADYAAVYLNHMHRASPCESVWLDDDHLAMQGPMFAVRSWHRRFEVGRESSGLGEDHLASELSFLAFMFAGERATLQDCADFMDEHPLRWVGEFAERVTKACGSNLYAAAAELTAAYLDELRGVLQEEAGIPKPSPEALAERLAPESPPTQLPPPSQGPGSGPTW